MKIDSNLVSKFDPKTIIIIVLLLASTVFGSMWFFSGDDASKERVKQLEKDFKKSETEKAAADLKIAEWREKYLNADKKDKYLEFQVSKLKVDSKISETRAKKYREDLDKVQTGITKTRNEIENLRKNPPVLTDDELLEALIKKTK